MKITYYGHSCFKIESPAGSALTTIEDRAFANCGVIPEPDTEEGFTDLVLPDGVTSIGADAFMNCPIVSLTLPASFDDFDSAMLNNCNTLTSLNVAEGNKTYASKDEISGNKDWRNKDGRPVDIGTPQSRVQEWRPQHPEGH